MEKSVSSCKQALEKNGFAIVENVFTGNEVKAINEYMEENCGDTTAAKELYAIRNLFTRLPGLKKQIINDCIKTIVYTLFGPDYFIVRGLFFNKPSHSNWFVAFHQDLSVPVSNRTDSAAYKNWTVKGDKFGVQPPVAILEDMYTIRIHLDDCTAQNGALRVKKGSHLQGIIEPAAMYSHTNNEAICAVPKGGVMIMRPLLLHASGKNTSALDRRVLHLEFCNKDLPGSIHWAEKEFIF